MGSELPGRGPGTAPRPPLPQRRHSLALAAVHIAGGVHELLDTGPRAVTLLTAHQGVAAKGLRLAGEAVGRDGAWGTDALACELVTEAAAAVTGCGCGHSTRSAGLMAALRAPKVGRGARPPYPSLDPPTPGPKSQAAPLM